jgi:hypothetical protein
MKQIILLNILSEMFELCCLKTQYDTLKALRKFNFTSNYVEHTIAGILN